MDLNSEIEGTNQDGIRVPMTLKKRIAEQEKYDVQFNVLDTRIYSLDKYIIAGNSDKALDVWEEADPDSKPAMKAREKPAELEEAHN